MRYVAGLCYALAIAAHSGALLNTLMLGALVFVGTVAVLFALEGIVKDAVRRPRRSESYSGPPISLSEVSVYAVKPTPKPGRGWRGKH